MQLFKMENLSLLGYENVSFEDAQWLPLTHPPDGSAVGNQMRINIM